ncbi:MAG TPA: PHP domain-containing protein [Ohtaekwangia sp.]|nr:PHP domain-containing protein [Ohtaekwangia sp.]
MADTSFGSGAQFVRADLHIHSYGIGGSFDVTDHTMTPEAIVDTAIEKNLSVISITDHNEIENVKRALNHASGKSILVIPGIEISTTQGHLLVYFPDYDRLKNFFGKLTIAPERDRCSQGICECLSVAEQFGGIGILAHIELSSGFEKMINRFGPHIEDIINHHNLWGLEISTKDSIEFYTDNDSVAERKKLINGRRQKLLLAVDYDLPKIMSSDSHTLNKLGVNADGETKLTRLKIDALDFQSFKIALINHGSRIRLENQIPERIPRFIKINIEGGLLDKQVVNFSSNLTCIIGGRGTGKSTLLESLRECSGNSFKAKVVNSEVWPAKIMLTYEDEAGQIHTFSLEKNSQIVNNNDPINGITKVQVESYGQGETAETIQHSDQNPQVLLNFLDSFIELKPYRHEENEQRQLLISNQSELIKFRSEVASIPETEKQKKALEGKLELLKQDKVGELVQYQTALIREREIRKNIAKDLKELIDKYRNILSDNFVFKNFEALVDNDIVVGKEYFGKVKSIVGEFSKIVESKSAELNDSLTQKVTELRAQLEGWTGKEKEIQDKIDQKKLDLEQKGIPFDIGKINQIASDVIYYQEKLKKLQQKDVELKALTKSRDEILKKRKELQDKIYYLRYGFATTVNDNLKNSVDGFFVDVKFGKGKYSPLFEDSIKSLMQWKTSRVPKAEYLASAMSPLEFASLVKKRNLSALKEIKDDEGSKVFSDDEIENILEKTLVNNNYEDYESMIFEDRPTITVSKEVVDEQGNKKIAQRSLSFLSLGQQQSILLAILLQSKSKVPLLIDQPEDNLDSEFISKTIVSNLRKIKEKRQVIIVTHNPNIAVLGDAELVIPLKSTNVRSIITDRGSIDRKETRDLCCDILEGGRPAFIRRKEIYGI